MNLDINWTVIISTCVSSAFSSATTFLVMRYLNKMAEKLEAKMKPDKPEPEDQAKHSHP